MSPDPVVSILVPTHENHELLRDCLVSIAATVDAQRVPYEIIVLFWQMSDEGVSSFMQDFPDVRALRARLNLGFCGGNNYAAAQAKGKYLVFLNDDTVTQSGWLEYLVAAVERDERIGAVGSRLIFPDRTVQEAGVILWTDGSCYPLGRGDRDSDLTYTYVRDVDYCSANGLLVRRSSFERAGGFDGRFYPAYYEDVDLCLTIRHRLGERIVYEPRSVIVHYESATTKRDLDFRDFLFRRNRAALVEKWSEELASYPQAQPESPPAIRDAVLRAAGTDDARILVIDDRLPNAAAGSGDGRTADLLADLSSWRRSATARDDVARYAIAFYPQDRRNRIVRNTLADLGVDLVLEPLREHVARPENRYDVAIVSRPHNFQQFAPLIREFLPDAAFIYDTEALYHRRLALQAQQETDPARRALLEAEMTSMQALETQIARSVDRIVTISETERAWLEGVEGHAPIEFMRPLAAIAPSPPFLEHRANAVFVAGWLAGGASPNVPALRWYAEQVFPRVRAALPVFTTQITGSHPPLRVQEIAGNGIVLLGHVASVAELYAHARIAISPMLAGAGVKIKTIEALQHGVPVVATSVGAEGLGLSDGVEIDIADDPEMFAQRIIALATDDALWLARRSAIEARLAQWESERRSWRDVIRRALAVRVAP
jgi:GT2 family glycosyltransferase